MYDVEEAFQNGFVLLFNSLKVKLCSSEIITSPCIIMDMGMVFYENFVTFLDPNSPRGNYGCLEENSVLL